MGALNGVLVWLGSIVVTFCTYNKYLNFLVSKLYWTNDLEVCDVTDSHTKIFRLNPEKQSSMIEYIQAQIPDCCLRLKCLRRCKSKKDIYF